MEKRPRKSPVADKKSFLRICKRNDVSSVQFQNNQEPNTCITECSTQEKKLPNHFWYSHKQVQETSFATNKRS